MPPHIPGATARPLASALVSMEGVVLSVERPRPEDNQSYVHVVLAPTGAEPIRLALAPGWYLDRQGIRYDAHENLRVEGRRGAEGEPSTLVVQRVHQGNRSYVLRDERDQPAWLTP